MAGEAVSKPPKLPMGAAVQIPTMLVISYFAALMEGNGRFSVGGFTISVFVCLFVMAGLSVFRQNGRNKRAGDEAAAIIRGRMETLAAP